MMIFLQLVQISIGVASISQSRTSDGRPCTDFIRTFIEGGEDDDEVRM